MVRGMKKYNFDELIDRHNTDSFKWDMNLQYFGREDVIPLWVADMDFACAPEIVEAIQERANHPIYGYTGRPGKVYEIVHQYLQNRHDYYFPVEWLCFCPPGLINAFYVLLKIATNPGDKVLLHSPNYGSLVDIVEKSGRIPVFEPLIHDGTRYHCDPESFRKTIKIEGIKAFILCNPNNPTGKVFTKEELCSMMECCEEEGVLVLSDEIYADFIFLDYKHIPAGAASAREVPGCVMAYSTNKGFNLGGLAMSSLIIPDKHLREAFLEEMEVAQTRLDTLFGSVAVQAAYSRAQSWLDECIEYVNQNKLFLNQFLEEFLPEIRATDSQATFLLWLDCSEMGLDNESLKAFFVQKAGLALSWGDEFGPGNDGWVRINLATPRRVLERALEKWRDAWEKEKTERVNNV